MYVMYVYFGSKWIIPAGRPNRPFEWPYSRIGQVAHWAALAENPERDGVGVPGCTPIGDGVHTWTLTDPYSQTIKKKFEVKTKVK